MAFSRRELLIHGGLYLAACATTTLAGGPAYAATLMAILTCHEFGHYLVARRHGVEVSLPYFIPLPLIAPGTFGAVIAMKKPIEDRAALFDVGAAGPIAGLIVTIPLLVIGLALSDVQPLHAGGNDFIEGNSILYSSLKLAVFGRWLPGNGVDVELHPMALGAWYGLLVTTINLMPIGQLDGGHIARAALGDRHEVWSRRLHVALPVVGVVVGSVMFAAAIDSGEDWYGALTYAKFGLIPWCVWGLMIWWMRRRAGEYHHSVSDTPLGPWRHRAALAMFVVFCLIATPVPFRPVL